MTQNLTWGAQPYRARHAMVVSGQAHGGVGQFGCATSGPQAMEGHWFGSASVGLPTEGYGVSNDAREVLAPPQWAKASFDLTDQGKSITINLSY